jgi:hypothetical protein
MCQVCFNEIHEGSWHLEMDVAECTLVGCRPECMQKRINAHSDEIFARPCLTSKDISAMF